MVRTRVRIRPNIMARIGLRSSARVIVRAKTGLGLTLGLQLVLEQKSIMECMLIT